MIQLLKADWGLYSLDDILSNQSQPHLFSLKSVIFILYILKTPPSLDWRNLWLDSTHALENAGS